MNQQENIKERILNLLDICKLSKKEYCEYMGFPPQNFTRSLLRNSIPLDEMNKYEELGINIRYIMLGKGNIYINNTNGKKVKHLSDLHSNSELHNHVYRLKFWINTHYESIQIFEEKYQITDKKYFEFKSNNFQIPIELKKILCHAGLNIKWLYNKSECPYNYSEMAKIKREWLLENHTSDNLIYLEMKGII